MTDDTSWRSLHGLPEPPQPGAAPAPDRRAMLRAAGASLALAAVAGCDGAAEDQAPPRHSRPRGVAQEDALHATVLDLEGLGRGVLVRSHAGHAVKVEGNPAHPASLGATDPFMQAAVLSLHDPLRARRHRRRSQPAEAQAVRSELATALAALAARHGEGLRLLTGPVASPTRLRLMEAVLARFPAAVWHVHDPLSDPAAAAATRRAFGDPVDTVFDLSRAEAILSLGGGLLDEGPAQLRQARDWATARHAGRVAGRLPALVVAEATPSLTGAKAERRLVLHPAEIETLVRAVAVELAVPGIAQRGDGHPEAPAIAAALRRAGPAGLVAAGRGQSEVVHALAQAMNQELGARGTTLHHIPPARAARAAPLSDLVAAMAAGAVTHLVILDVNPAHDAPAEFGFPALLRAVPASLHLGAEVDETALLCTWHLPMAHPFEAWGDSRAFDGTAAIRQPVTRRLVPDATSIEDLLAALAGLPGDGAAAVRETWRDLPEEAWRATLESGVVDGSAAGAVEPSLRPDWDPGPTLSPGGEAGGLTALFVPDPHLRDGAFAGNAWLQEMPRPLTGLAWGNAALLAPATLAAQGLAPGDIVELELDGRRLALPAWPLAGQAPDTVTLPLGHGRPTTGIEGGGGFDTYRLRPAEAPWVAPGLTLRRTGARRLPVATDHHHDIGVADVIRSLAPGEALPPPRHARSLYPDWPYREAAWGMVIDLDTCIGCNACAIACQAENNVPVVGPEETARGRAMHWLRVDRHHLGEAAAPATVFQPVPCMHCEKAPCEVVCPVNATVHDSEGLNAMVYARCIGTRTCSNNCPYKVRRFNWFDIARQGGVRVSNPEVSVRPRGVMEKCTYCSHRIAAARSEARAGGQANPPRDSVTTACAEACPTRAITFGDLNDPGSAVAQARASDRNYALLGHLDVRPRTTYLARSVPPEDES